MSPLNKIIEMRFGSHLYGTNTPSSDLDLKSVYLPTKREILLGRVKPVVQNNTKSDTSQRNSSEDVDSESFSLQRYLSLLSEGQTVAVDMLFAPPSAFTTSLSVEWQMIRNNRSRLLSSKASAFIGYCRQQANKYGIKGSRMAAAKSAVGFFEYVCRLGHSKKVGDYEPEMEEVFSGMENVEFVAITNPAGFGMKHLSVCGRKVPFTQSVQEAHKVYQRLFDEYGKRTLQAMSNENVDWKALSHAVRVGNQGVELLKTSHVTFPRPEAAHLIAIKTGQLPYVEVAEEIEQLLLDVEAAALVSGLPPVADHGWIDDFVTYIHENVVRFGSG